VNRHRGRGGRARSAAAADPRAAPVEGLVLAAAWLRERGIYVVGDAPEEDRLAYWFTEREMLGLDPETNEYFDD
jgi:hypothetical protein